MAAKGEPEKLLTKHGKLIHSDDRKVTSHRQREQDDGWLINTIMIEGVDVPFRYKRQKKYKNLQGSRVNMTYYAATEKVAGMEMEVMKVVRLRRS